MLCGLSGESSRPGTFVRNEIGVRVTHARDVFFFEIAHVSDRKSVILDRR